MDILTNWILWITALTALILLYKYLTKDFGYWESQGVPSEKAYPIIGSEASLLKKEMFEMDVERMKKHGRIYGTYFLGGKSLSVTDPEIIKFILVKDFHVFVNRQGTKSGIKMFDLSVSLAMDDDWKRIRSVITPTFSSGKIKKMLFILKRCAESLTGRFLKMAEKGEITNAREDFSKFSIEVIGSCAFGLNFDSVSNPNHPFILNTKKFFARGFLAIFTFILLGKLPNWLNIIKRKTAFTSGMTYFEEIAKEIIEKRRSLHKEKNVDFLQLMVDAKEGKLLQEKSKEINGDSPADNIEKKPQWTKTLDEDEIVAQCAMFLAVGHDTVALTTAYVAYNLACNQDVQENVIREVDETWEKYGEIDYDVLNKMTYLDAVVSETLRLQSLVVRLQRQAKEDYRVPNTNIVIPKNAMVVIPVYALHHDPEIFPDPYKFDPDRFLPENKDNIIPFSYLPFGDGPRNCIARRFALMEVKLGLTYVLRKIKFSATEETKKPLKLTVGLGVLQCDRIIVKPERR